MNPKNILLVLMALAAMMLPWGAGAQNVSVWDGTTQAFTQGSGTESTPYLIENAQQLAYIAEQVNEGYTHYEETWFKLVTDVQIDSTTQWEPIGANVFTQFSGHFDGNGHTITLYLNTTNPYAGIFGWVLSGSFSNLISAGKISMETTATEEVCIGGIVAKAQSTNITNCQNTVTISPVLTVAGYSTTIGIGGIAGSLSNNWTNITNCHNLGAITPTITVSGNITPTINIGGFSGSYGGGHYITCSNSGAITPTVTVSGNAQPNINIGGIISGQEGESWCVTCLNSGEITPVFTVLDNSIPHVIIGGISRLGGVFDNCLNLGAISVETYGTGIDLLMGGITSSGGNCNDCQNSGALSLYGSENNNNYYGYTKKIGGIIGNGGTLITCYNSGHIISSLTTEHNVHLNLGGISAGYSNIYKSHNSGNISAIEGRVGGISAFDSRVTESFNTGTLIGSEVYGIANGTCRNCYNVGGLVMTTPTSDYSYGLCGISGGSETTENNYYLNTCGSNQFIPGGLPLSEAQMKTPQFVNLLNKDSVVFIMDTIPFTNAGYPVFGNTPIVIDSILSIPLAGDGTQQNPYLIEDMVDMTWLSNATNSGDLLLNGLVESHFKLVNDLTIDNTVNWQPIGEDTPFMGHFDGNGHTVTWNVIPNISEYYGVFAIVYQGSVSHLHAVGTLSVEDPDISDIYLGGLIGYAYDATLLDCHNGTNISLALTTNAPQYGNIGVGGICGAFKYHGNPNVYYPAAVQYCSNTGSITCSAPQNYTVSGNARIGGLIGYTFSSWGAQGASVVDCYNSGNITNSIVNGYVGGISGYMWGSPFLRCYNEGNIEGNGGGAYGIGNAWRSEECCNKGNIVCSNGRVCGIGESDAIKCYNTGNLSGNEVAGIVVSGYRVKYCYNMGTISGNTVAGIGLNATEISNCYNAGTLSGTTRWGIYQVRGDGNENVSNCYFLNTCGANQMSQAFARSATVMKQPAFVDLLNVDSVVFVMDFPPYVNQGYPIFGEVVTLEADALYGNAANLSGRYRMRFNVDTVGFAYKAVSDSDYTVQYVPLSGSDTVSSLVSGLLTGNYTYYFFIKKDGITYRGTDRTFSIINCPFTLTLDAPITAFCEGDSVLITAQITGPNPDSYHYLWSTGDSTVNIVADSATTSIYASAAILYSITVTNSNNCANVLSQQMSYHPVVEASISGADFLCPNSGSVELTAEGGLYYNWSTGILLPSITITEPGTYTVTATNGNGCTGVATKVVSEGQTYNIPLTHTICEGESYDFYGQELTTAGTYTHNFQAVNSCDSMATLTLTVNPLPNVAISGNNSFCQGGSTTLIASGANTYTWSNTSTEATITVSNYGVYTVIGTDANGCSSTASKTVTVTPNYNTPLSQSICQGDIYDFYGQILTMAGTYTHTLQTASGCDSMLTLTLIVNPLPNVLISGNSSFCENGNTELTASGASAYVWSNEFTDAVITVSESGVYTVTGTDANGCVNTAAITITVNPTYNTPLTYSICEGESFDFYGQNLTTTGTYTHTLQSVSGCDSVLSLTLTVNPLPNVTIIGNSSFCQGENTILTAFGTNNYKWNNDATDAEITISEAGSYTVTGTDANGCANIASFTVTVNPTYNVTLTHSICEGESYDFFGQNLTVEGTYTHTLQTVDGCDSVLSLTLSVNPLPNVTILGGSSLCQGDNLTASNAQTYVWSDGSENDYLTVNESGVYSVTGTDTNGCANTATLMVAVNPTYNVVLAHSICEGESYNFYGQDITEAGTYTHTLQTVNGCDSVLTLVVTQESLPSMSISGNTTICEGETTTLTASGASAYAWSNETAESIITVSEAGVYTVTGTGVSGCSSIAMVTVSVNPVYNVALTHSICEGESYDFYGQNLITAGTYTHTLQSVSGCDSVITLTLTVNPLPNVTISGSTSLCQGENITASGAHSYVWSEGSQSENIAVSESGTYSVTGTDASGCTNIASFTVTMNPTYNVTLTHSICEGESYDFFGQTLTTEGTYTHTLQTVDGCDSVLLLTLSVNPLPNVTISGGSSLCQGDNLTASGAQTYVWSDGSENDYLTVNESGIYSVTGTDTNGCANTTSVSLTVNPTYNVALTHSICEGESYNFYGQNITEAGTYTHTLQTINGCDSVLTLIVTLEALPSITITGNTTICEGEMTTLSASGASAYVWSDETTDSMITISEAGVYTVTGTGVDGCGSIAMVTVSVNPVYNVALTHSICEGESYDFYGQNLITAGTYTHTLQSVSGCDSVITLTLTVNPLPNVAISGGNSLCQDENITASGAQSYMWSDGSQSENIAVSESGTYIVTGTDANGCANTVAITVAVKPTYTVALAHSICEGESYDFFGQNLTMEGTYAHTLQTVNGCDSVLVLTLSVNPLPNVTISGGSSICQGDNLTASGAQTYVWSDGSENDYLTVNESGIYTVTGTDINGCANTASVTVIANPTYNVALTHSICEGESYNFFGQDLSTTGTYTHTLLTINGCDSVLTLTLTVNPLPNVTISGSSSLCQGENITASGAQFYAWSDGSHGENITVVESGTYSVTGTDANGCANTVAITVAVNPTYNVELTHSICEGEIYNFYGQIITTAGTYTHTLQTVNGCDSVLTLLLTVNPLPNVTISGNNSFCQGDNTSLTASGASIYSWSNEATDTAIIVSNAGIYTVTGTDINGCSNTAEVVVTVNPTYDVAITHSICEGGSYNFYGQNLTTAGTYTHTLHTVNGCDSVLTLTLIVKPLPNVMITVSCNCQVGSPILTASGASTYIWSNGSTGALNIVNSTGTYTVIGTDATGCMNVATVNVSVNDNPDDPVTITQSICQGENYNFFGQNLTTAGTYTHTLHTVSGCDSVILLVLTVNPLPNVSISGNSSFCQGDNVTLTATGANTYAWNNSQSQATITVSNPGTYTVTGTDANGCSNIATKTVSVNPTYNIPLTHSICQGESYNFYGQNLTTAGIYTHTMQTVNGCDSVLTLTLTVKTLPTPTITGNTSLCQGQSTTLTVNGGVSYLWNNGSTNNNISVSQSGVYTVTATNAEGCSATANVSVTVNPLPNVGINGNSSFCQGSSVVLTANGASSYSWSNGSSNATITVSNPGTYTLIGTDANNCTNTATKTVTANPTYNVPITHSICQGDSYNFNGQNLTTAGTYTHNLSTVNGCDSIVTLTLTVKSLPTPVILGNTTLCQGQSTSLSANGGVSYHWSNGSTNNNINVSQSGVYMVTATNAEGCSATANVTVTVNPLPSVNLSGNNSFCQGDNVTLTATGASAYVWNNASTNASINVCIAGTYTVTGTDANGCSNYATRVVTANPVYNISQNQSICQGQSYLFNGQYLTTSGTYTQNLSTVNGCDSIVTLTLTVKSLPTPVILGNTTLCQGQSTSLSANGGVSYLWNNGSTNNNINVSQSGVYTVTATNAEGCSATANVTVTVNPLPSVNISGNNSFCQGDNVTLTATGASTYVWNNASTNASINVSSAGTYTVTGTDANGCSNIATKTVSVNPTYNIPLTHSMCEGESYNFYGQNITAAGTYTHTLQTVSGCDSVLTLVVTLKALPPTAITGNTSLCDGETTTLTVSGGVSYLWSNGGTNNNISVSQSGVYTVTATNAEGCSATANVTVTVNPLPSVTIAGNTTLCAGNSTTLTAMGADSYSWSTGDNTASVSISAFGIYTVTGTTTAGCSGTANATVLVSQLPVITITGETDICAGESTTLTANGGETYLWSDGTTANTLTVGMAGTYQVIGYNTAGCNAMASATVNVWQPATSEFTVVSPDSCYSWNGESYCQSGDYTQTLQTVHGCDSIVTLHLTITVGVEEYNAFDFKVYPNPTNGVVNVQCTMNNERWTDGEIHVLDMYGRLLNVVGVNSDSPLRTAQIDLSRYANGVYFIKMVADDKTIAVQKVVKQ